MSEQAESLKKATTSWNEWIRHVYLPRFVATSGPRMLGTLTPPTRAMPPKMIIIPHSFCIHCGIVTVWSALQTSYSDVATSIVTKHTSGLEITSLGKICTRPMSARFLSIHDERHSCISKSLGLWTAATELFYWYHTILYVLDKLIVVSKNTRYDTEHTQTGDRCTMCLERYSDFHKTKFLAFGQQT